jgi:predicted ATPase
VLDDLHWSDVETLDLLAHLLRVGQEAPLAVVATMRTDALADRPSLSGWLGACAAEGLIAEERLAPLPPEATARLAVALGRAESSPAELERLQDRTGGLPLLVVESLRGEPGSSRVGAVLTQRLAALSPRRSRCAS